VFTLCEECIRDGDGFDEESHCDEAQETEEKEEKCAWDLNKDEGRVRK